MSETARERVPVGEWVSSGARETFELGTRAGASLEGGEILLLDGPLGAGKIMPTTGAKLYRLAEGASAAHAVDLDELLADESAVVIIEWAERMRGYPLPPTVWRVRIEGDGEDPRRISVARA